jgi:hypothetical protein
MDIQDSSKYLFTPKIKKKLPLHAQLELLPIEECLLDFVMLLQLSNAA